MKARISKHFSDGRHDGWKKTVAGREWFLGYGIAAGDEAKAKKLAAGLEAKWQLIKLSGGSELRQSDFDEIKDLVNGRPQPSTPPTFNPVSQQLILLPVRMTTPEVAAASQLPRAPGHSLFEAIDIFMGTLKRQIKPDDSNADHMLNTCARIVRAKDGVADMPFEFLRRKELDDWLAFFGARPPSRTNGKPISTITIRNIAQAMRMFLNQCIEWEWWTPPPLWERAFQPYTVKKLSTDAEKRIRRKRPETHGLAEKRVLWHLATPFDKAMMALADWAGHTQMEVTTLHFDEFFDVTGEMYIDRHRNKTGVQGRWWIPPEAAAAIRVVMAKTPRDPKFNPNGLAFLTPNGNPLVHRSKSNRRAKSDFVGQEWSTLLRWAKGWGVRNISYKYMRKSTSQMVRDRTNMELSKVFCAQALDDIQDIHYTRPSFDQLEKCVREIYAEIKGMFEPIAIGNHERAIEEVYLSQGLTPPNSQQSAA